MARPIVPLVLVLSAACALVGCATDTGPAAPLPSTEAPLPVVEDMDCGNVVSSPAVAAALTGSSDMAPTPTEAVQPSRALDLALLEAVGGLACSWRVGEPPERIGDERGDWAYLTVEVLPGAAAEWVPPYAGDSPSDEIMNIAGVEARSTAGESGWRISAPVEDAWIDVTVTSAGLISGGGRFDGAAFDAELEAMRPVAEEAFAALLSGAALPAPPEPALEVLAECRGGLDLPGIASALQLESAEVSYEAIDSRTGPVFGLADRVQAVASQFTCELAAEQFGVTSIAVLRGYAGLIDTLGDAPDTATTLQPVALMGASGEERAYVARRDDGPRSPLFFTVGDTLYRIDSDGAASVAEAIIAQTR